MLFGCGGGGGGGGFLCGYCVQCIYTYTLIQTSPMHTTHGYAYYIHLHILHTPLHTTHTHSPMHTTHTHSHTHTLISAYTYATSTHTHTSTRTTHTYTNYSHTHLEFSMVCIHPILFASASNHDVAQSKIKMTVFVWRMIVFVWIMIAFV